MAVPPGQPSSAAMPEEDAHRADRLELILHQLDSLPTLPEVAMRLLQLTSDDESEAQDVVELVRCDPALTSKVLAMCRAADRGSAQPVTTVDRAVVALGFEAIRNAVLSIKVFEAFSDEPPSIDGSGAPGEPDASGGASEVPSFSQPAFWRHSLAVAIAAELIAERHAAQLRPVRPGEAFMCGLLHDVGKLAMDHLLPKSYQRVVELTDQHQLNIAEVERRVIGLDHHTVGKRLAEHWQLPRMLRECVWLHGAAPMAMPEVEHGLLIGVVSVADLLARQRHLGYSGNYWLEEDPQQRARQAGLDPAAVRDAADRLHEELERRAAAMGLGKTPSRQLFLDSILQANRVLGRLNERLETQRRAAAGQTRALTAISRFHASLAPGAGVQRVLAEVAASAATVFGAGYYGTLYQVGRQQAWLLSHYSPTGRMRHSRFIEPAAEAPSLDQLHPGGWESMDLMRLAPWLAEHLPGGVEPREVKLVPLMSGGETAAALLHEREDPPPEPLEALLRTWGSAVATATRQRAARRLSERLVEAGRELAETQQKLLQKQSMARLGEMAAGAAHEMNNPLAVISGRAQLLAHRLRQEHADPRDAEQIHQQAQRLSELITALRLFAEPPQPRFVRASAAEVVEAAVRRLRKQEPEAAVPLVTGLERAPALWTDPEHLASALAELLLNAAQAESRDRVRVSTSVDLLHDRFVIQVIDTGHGMDLRTQEHAFDPFYSNKPAGRRVGLGLARAKRLAQGLGGDIDLMSGVEKGTTAVLSVPLSVEGVEGEPAETPGAAAGPGDPGSSEPAAGPGSAHGTIA